MSDTRIISIPSLEFTYVDYKLESIVAGGELYIRHHSLESESVRERARVSRYHELFGTPEKAARVIVALNNCRVVCCEDCAARGACRYDGCGDDYDALLEWLRGDAE